MAPTNLLFSAFPECHFSKIINFRLEQSKLVCLENVLETTAMFVQTLGAG
jgi:hypothetical protein